MWDSRLYHQLLFHKNRRSLLDDRTFFDIFLKANLRSFLPASRGGIWLLEVVMVQMQSEESARTGEFGFPCLCAMQGTSAIGCAGMTGFSEHSLMSVWTLDCEWLCLQAGGSSLASCSGRFQSPAVLLPSQQYRIQQLRSNCMWKYILLMFLMLFSL